jgi:hypothetical protein
VVGGSKLNRVGIDRVVALPCSEKLLARAER